MKNLVGLFVVIMTLTLCVNSQASTYLWFWVEGDTGHTITQGQNLAWEIDVSTPGNQVTFGLYLDLDQSRTYTPGDYFLQEFWIGDGGESDGPADSSVVPDGIIYVEFGQFGFAPQDYLMIATDEDESVATGWFTVVELAEPPATISGKVYIEGKEPPDPVFRYIMIGTFSENGIFSALTDENGNYQMNLPTADLTWEISPLFENSLPGYILQTSSIQVLAPAGDTDSIDFYYAMPQAWVYGDLRDQDGTLIDRDGYLTLENVTTNSESYGQITSGSYSVPAVIEIQGTDSTNEFRLRVQNETLIPDYMIPDGEQVFPISVGDSVRRNITTYAADTVIYGFIRQNGENPDKGYRFYAWSQLFGSTETFSDPQSGSFILNVRDGSDYSIHLQSDPQWGTPPPPGYYFEQSSFYNVYPGDTVYFNILPAEGALAGTISFDPGDPVVFDYDRNNVNAWDSSYTNYYGSRVGPDNSYSIPVPNGKYNVSFNPEENNYLVMPSWFNNIVVQQDTVDTLNFLLNYGHAQVVVKLINAPVPGGWNEYNISSAGIPPYVYETRRLMQSDSTFHFDLCEGEWYIQAPIYSETYEVFPTDTVLTITEEDSSAYIEFVYKLQSSVDRQDEIPASFNLVQNYPNPFNPSTTIEYALTKAGHVKLTVYNLLGERVTTLVDKNQTTGRYSVQWNPEFLASGVYLYRLEAQGKVMAKKMLLMR